MNFEMHLTALYQNTEGERLLVCSAGSQIAWIREGWRA